MKRNILFALIIVLFMTISIAIYLFLKSLFTNDISGDAQVIIEIIGLPLIIVGFYIAIEEFRKTQLFPDLQLYWQGDAATEIDDNKAIIFRHSPYNEKKYYLHLYLHNKGNILANWFRVQFEIPRIIATYQSENQKVNWSLGDNKNISVLVNMEIVRHVFKSNGDIGIYPNEIIPIATWEVRIFQNIHYPESVPIITSIVTDKTSIMEEILTLKFIEEGKIEE